MNILNIGRRVKDVDDELFGKILYLYIQNYKIYMIRLDVHTKLQNIHMIRYVHNTYRFLSTLLCLFGIRFEKLNEIAYTECPRMIGHVKVNFVPA